MAIGKTNCPPGGTDTSDADAVAADILDTKTAYGAAGTKITETMPNIGAQSITPAAAGNSISAGYHNGGGGVAADDDFIAANIKLGVNIWGVVGAYVPTITWGAETTVALHGKNVGYRMSSDGKMALFSNIYNSANQRFPILTGYSDGDIRGDLAAALGKTLSSYIDMPAVFYTTLCFGYSVSSPYWIDIGHVETAGSILCLLIFT